MEKIEYINVVPTISVQSDGVGKFVRNLHLAISNSLVESSICSQDLRDKTIFESVTVFPGCALTGRFKFSIKLLMHIRQKMKHNSLAIFHFHGLWMWVNFLPLFIWNINYIYSPHGSISKYTYKNWSFFRRLIFKHIQLIVLNQALFVHATSNIEVQWLIEAGVNKDLIKVIPLCDKQGDPKFLQSSLHKKNRNTFVFVGRVVPIKNLERLLQAFQNISHEYNNANLQVIGGLNDSYSLEIKSKFQCRSITFTGQLSPAELEKRMRDADFFVLPSFSENFSYSALEACNAGCKLLISQYTPWNQLAPSFVEASFDPTDVVSITQALSIACRVDEIVFEPTELKKFSNEAFYKALNKEVTSCNQTLSY
jgi:glycosyltransferase involved in cell wall biosynthesis